MSKRFVATILAAILCSLSAGTSHAGQKRGHSSTASRKAKAPELGTVAQFKDAFQSDQGKIRLVALISPT
jgi:hypothetical protein